MKVGDYVRTKSGYIGRITSIDNEMNRVYYNTKKMTSAVPIQDIVKYAESKEKIINLIKEGDLVNNHIVGQIFYENQTIDNIKYLDLEGVNILVCNEDIKSIVTKEQFERMEYKI